MADSKKHPEQETEAAKAKAAQEAPSSKTEKHPELEKVEEREPKVVKKHEAKVASKNEQIAHAREKFAKQVDHELEVIAHGDPETEKKIKEFEATQAVTDKEAKERWYKRLLTTPDSQKKLTVGVKVFAVLLLIGTAVGLAAIVDAIFQAVKLFSSGGMNDLGISTIVVTWIRLANLVLVDGSFAFLAIQLLRAKRNVAALFIYVLYVLTFIGAICDLMLFGIDLRLIAYGVSFVILIAFQVYLDPELRQERQLQRMLRDNEVKQEQKAGILGRDLTGKGYVKLDFFNLFWIFVICSFLGDIMETLFHVIVVDPGQWQDRAGLLFGQFSPIYGCGAVLMTLFLNNLYKRNILLVFVLSAIIGGAFEVFVSYFMQYTFGAVAWNYTGQFLSLFGGRTCGLAMFAWGLLGVAWLKLLLPGMLWLIGKIPWKWRYSVTTVAAAFMAVDCVMSLMAYDCWYERLAHDPINTPIKEFYAKYFDNSWMENRFQSMTVDPSYAVRGGA